MELSQGEVQGLADGGVVSPGDMGSLLWWGFYFILFALYIVCVLYVYVLYVCVLTMYNTYLPIAMIPTL